VYGRILVAVDHSEPSDRAVLAARDLAVLSRGEVWVLHLREREMGFKTGVLPPDETAHGEVRNTVFGYAAREIVDDAREVDADVIVMGSRGRSDITGLLLGSTAHKVIHLSDRPVLVVR
jgi:nucleotide-binding universal stress UspA family protein